MFVPLAFHKESIVNRGLVFHFDAADRTSYSPSNTKVKDLVAGDIDFEIRTGNGYTPTFDSTKGGSIHFNNPRGS